jgi:replication-associated recombination protein RarA
MQKAIRRGDARIAGYFAIEMFASGFDQYCWRRLITVSAEDCWGILTAEIRALYDSFQQMNTPRKPYQLRGRIFIAKAVLLLCEAKKSRDADHLTNFVYDRGMIDPQTLIDALANADPEPIPEYAYDVHTAEGRRQGKTRADFFRDEQAALHPKQPGLFDDLVPAPQETHDRPVLPTQGALL